MGQIEVFQLHGTDIVGVGYLYLLLVVLHDLPAVFIQNELPGYRVTLRPFYDLNFCFVPGFRFHSLGQDILLLKKHFQIVLYIGKGKDPFVKGRENGDQHIGVVLDIVKIIVVFIVAMGAFVGIQVFLQLRFHGAVGFLCGQHIRILRQVGGTEYAAHAGTCHHGTGGHAADQYNNDSCDPDNGKDHLAVLLDKGSGFLCRLLRPDRCRFCRRRCFLRVFLCLPHLFGIVPLDTLFLQIPGYRVGGRKAGIILDRFLIQNLRIGFVGCLLRLGCIPPGFGFVMMERLPHPTSGMKHTLFRQFFGLVPGFHTHIFLLHFVDFVVGGKGNFLGRTAQRIVPQLSVGLFLHFLKTDGSLTLAGGFIKYPFLHLYCLGGDLRLGSIQFVRCPVRTFNVLAKGRISTFLVCKLQPGGWTLPGLAPFLDSSRVLFGSLSLPVPGMGMGSFFDCRFCKEYRFLLGIEMGFFLTAADALHLAGGKVFSYRAVMGHFLRHLFRCFHFLHSDPPSFPKGQIL